MADTLTRYLKLKIADDLSADAKYNLQRIDSLGASIGSTFVTGLGDKLNILSRGDIQLVPKDSSIGGPGSGGAITLGDSSNLATVIIEGSAFRLNCGLSLKNSALTANNYLTVSFLNAINLTTPQSLTIGVGTGNRSITFPFDGVVVTTTGIQTLVDKDITGIFTGPLTGNVTGNVSGTASNVTGVVAVANGGTGASSASAAMVNLLPSYTGNEDRVLALNSTGTALEWKAAGAGQVVSVTAAGGSPIIVTGSATNPIVGIAQSGAGTDGYLSALDWATFNNKEPYLGLSNATQYLKGDRTWATLDTSAVSGLNSALSTKEPVISAGTTSQYWRGDKSWQTLDTTAVAEGTNLYFTGTRARDEVVVNSPTWSETTYAPSAAAVAGYVAAYSGGVYATTWQGTTSTTLTHSLGTADISVNIYDLSTGQEILIDDIVRGDGAGNNLTSQVTLTASQLAPTGVGNGWRVVVRK